MRVCWPQLQMTASASSFSICFQVYANERMSKNSSVLPITNSCVLAHVSKPNFAFIRSLGRARNSNGFLSFWFSHSCQHSLPDQLRPMLPREHGASRLETKHRACPIHILLKDLQLGCAFLCPIALVICNLNRIPSVTRYSSMKPKAVCYCYWKGLVNEVFSNGWSTR